MSVQKRRYRQTVVAAGVGTSTVIKMMMMVEGGMDGCNQLAFPNSSTDILALHIDELQPFYFINTGPSSEYFKLALSPIYTLDCRLGITEQRAQYPRLKM